MKIAVAGLGYVGLSLSVLLAQRHAVRALDIDPKKVAALRAGQSPVEDPGIARALREGGLDLTATDDPAQALAGADFVVIATPTSYDPVTDRFDTASVEAVARTAHRLAPQASVVIKSTVPVGFTAQLNRRLDSGRILVSPEFLREGQALHDNLHPARIVVGGDGGGDPAGFAALLAEAAVDPGVPVLLCPTREAEAIKLFANAYLAMRVAFFNELDSYALTHGLDSRRIIEGVGLDPRIGGHYNNPSFGYGGYCLPKDTRQLLANYDTVPQNLIRAIVESNATRKEFIARQILDRQPRRVGIYRLAMKAGSDNFRDSSVLSVLHALRAGGVAVTIYEPLLPGPAFEGVPVEADLARFKADCDLIVANRLSPALEDVAARVFTRDIFGTG